MRSLFATVWERALALADWPDETKEAVLRQQFEAQHDGYRSAHPEADHELILVDGEPVGRLYVRREAEVIGLMDISLLPAWRNRGLGSRLIRDLLAEAREGGQRVELYVEKWNPDARRLYLRLGFADREDIGTHWMMEWRPDESPHVKKDS
ncbi:MAG: GNAT family N-acetyltransferase [Akkermansiaceae bacterium]|nr:GNAT family N-acetyltransferase [Akkermansiaceae bacterium]